MLNIGDWSSGMIGVSKTFGGGSIPSSPVSEKCLENLVFMRVSKLFYFLSLKEKVYLDNKNSR